MNNTAQIVNFPQQESENDIQGRDYVKADTKNGFTQLANELLDHLATLDITKRQWRVMISLVRKTYGFNKKTDWVVGEQLATHMKYDGAVTHIHSDIRELKARNIVIEDGRKIGPNPVVSEWVLTPNKPKSVTDKTNRNRSQHKPKSVTAQTEIGSNSDGKRSTQKKDTITKDTITKDSVKNSIKKIILPDWLPSDLWDEFIQMRKSIKKPMTENAMTRMINKLQKFQDAGINATEQLIRSIDNCYSDVYEPQGYKAKLLTKKAVTENFNDKDYGETQIPAWFTEDSI